MSYEQRRLYVFLVQFNGHVTETHVASALDELRACVSHVRVLGSFVPTKKLVPARRSILTGRIRACRLPSEESEKRVEEQRSVASAWAHCVWRGRPRGPWAVTCV